LLQRHSVSLLRFESPDSNPRGLVLPRPEPRWTYQVEAQFVCEALDASIGADFIPQVWKVSSRARLIRLLGHPVLQTVDLPSYLTYGIRTGYLATKIRAC
jgi:hypothetical protein